MTRQNRTGTQARWFYGLALGGGLGAALAAVPSVDAQPAYFSTQGQITAANGEHDFFVTLSRDVGSAETLAFFTQSDVGGTNSAGDFVAATGFDSVLTLSNPFVAGVGGMNDDGGPDEDAFLSWASAGATGGVLNPDPLDSGVYNLKVEGFGGSTGAWSVDLVGPTDALIFNGASGTDSTLTSLKFGTETPTATPAQFSYTIPSALTITGELVVAPTGSAALTQSNGTINVGGGMTVRNGGGVTLTGGNLTSGIGSPFVVEPGGVVDVNGGTLTTNANGTSQATDIRGTVTVAGGTLSTNVLTDFRVNAGGVLNVNSGTLDIDTTVFRVDGGTLNINTNNATLDLVAGGGLAASNNGQVNVTGDFTINNGRNMSVTTGADLIGTTSTLRVGDATGGTLTVDGMDSGVSGHGQTVVGANGAAGTVTVRNGATAGFGSNLIVADTTGMGSTGTVNIESGATATAGSLFIADVGTDSPGLVSLTGTGSTLTLSSGGGNATIGQATGGTGTLTVGSGGTFNAGTGHLNVYSTGTINVLRGTANFNGDVLLDGGTLSSGNPGPSGPLADINLAAGVTVTVANGGTFTYTERVNPSLLDAADKKIVVDGVGSSLNSGDFVVAGGNVDATAGGTINLSELKLHQGAVTVIGTSDGTPTGSPSTLNSSAIVDVVGSGMGNVGTLTLSEGATADLGTNLVVGTAGGEGNIVVNRGTLTTGNITLANGDLTVTGSSNQNGVVNQQGFTGLTVGPGVSGSVGEAARIDIDFHGVINTGPNGINVVKGGTLVAGQGTLNANGNIVVDRGLFARTSENFGAFTLAAGKDVTLRNGGNISFSDDFDLPDGSTLTAQSGAAGFIFNLDAGVGAGQTGTVVVEGENTLLNIANFGSLSTPGLNRLGSDGGSFDLTVRDDGELRFIRETQLAGGTAPDATATVSVTGGATLQVGDLKLVPDGSAGGDATITVSGVGSTLEVRLGSQTTIDLGSAAGGTGRINLVNGGSFNGGERIIFGQNTLNIHATGIVDLDPGGSFFADTVNNTEGGTFNFNAGTVDFDTYNGDLTQDGGTLTPNVFDRAMVINGDYDLNAGAIDFELRSGFDNSVSAEGIDLGAASELNVALYPGDIPAVGSMFTILQSDTTIVGTFGAENIPVFEDRTFDVVYNALSVVLETVVAVSLDGDLNGDGFVSQADLDLVLLNWGQAVPAPFNTPAGWINDLPDTLISQNELDSVLLNWGNGTPPNLTAIPEPGTGVLVGVLLGLAGVPKRRYRGARAPFPAD